MKKSIVIIFIILLVTISFVLGYYISYLNQKNIFAKEKTTIIQETKETIKNRLIEGDIIWPEAEEINSLSGIINEVGDNYLIINPEIIGDPLGDIFPEKVKVIINSNTVIEQWTPMTGTEYEKILEPYKDRNCAEEYCEIPDPFYKRKAIFNEIKQYYKIWTAQSEENIKHQSEFVAEFIAFEIK